MDETTPNQATCDGVQALLFRVGEPAELVVLEPDESGFCFESMRGYVKGLDDYLDVLELGGGPTLWINTEAIKCGMGPNRIVIASREMEDAGCRSRIDGRPVRASEPYDVLFGPILAVGKCDEGIPTDITVEEAVIACRMLERLEVSSELLAELTAAGLFLSLLDEFCDAVVAGRISPEKRGSK